METIKLAIVTDDEDYGRALSMALVNVYKTFTVTLFKRGQMQLGEGLSFDLILADVPLERTRKIQLVEKPSQVKKNYDSREFSLYKYSNVRELAGELLFLYSFFTGRKAVPVKNDDLKVVLLGAAEGGCGCTGVAMALAQSLKRFFRKKVLYLSLEEIESTPVYMEPFPGGKNLGEYLYYLFNKEEENVVPFSESFLVLDEYGVEAFSPSKGRNLLNTLSSEEMQFFLSTLMNTSRYDFIIIDAGNNLGKSALCCYEMANAICIVQDLQSSPYKTNRLLEYLLSIQGEAIRKRMGVIPIGEKKEGEESQKEGIVQTVCTLPIEKESFSIENGLRRISLDSGYGQGIGKLADLIIHNSH